MLRAWLWSLIPTFLLAVPATTVYLHRTVTHRALVLHPLVNRWFRFTNWISTGVDPAVWAAIHRKHHAYSDVEVAPDKRDPHSPWLEGFWHIQLGNVWYYIAELRRHPETLTVFALHFPARLFRADNAGATRAAVAAVLHSIDSVLAEPIADLLVRDAAGNPCIEAKSPVDLEESVGLPGGNIWHRSLQWPWAESPDEVGTWGVETPHEGLLIAGAGARRGGGVSGIPGHNAARAVLDEAIQAYRGAPSFKRREERLWRLRVGWLRWRLVTCRRMGRGPATMSGGRRRPR